MARSKSWRFLPGLIMFIPIVRMVSYVLFPAYRQALGMMLHTGVDAILIGCYAALKQEKIKQFLDSPKVTATLVNIVTFIFFIIIPFIASRAGGYWAATYGRTIEAALAALLILTIIHKENFWLSKILRMKFFVSIGTVSFSLYLWQQVFNGVGSPIGLMYPFNIVQAIAAAYLSYWIIETPFLRINEKMKKKKAAAIRLAIPAEGPDRKDSSPS
jgi:peptidoglycan/LPS O-acetylase OafA/YrhL